MTRVRCRRKCLLPQGGMRRNRGIGRWRVGERKGTSRGLTRTRSADGERKRLDRSNGGLERG